MGITYLIGRLSCRTTYNQIGSVVTRLKVRSQPLCQRKAWNGESRKGQRGNDSAGMQSDAQAKRHLHGALLCSVVPATKRGPAVSDDGTACSLDRTCLPDICVLFHIGAAGGHARRKAGGSSSKIKCQRSLSKERENHLLHAFVLR